MPSQPTTFLLWWSLRLSLIAGCLAVVLRSFQQQQQQQPLFDPTPSNKTNATTKTYCYQGIRPSSHARTVPDACLVVDLATGEFASDVVPRRSGDEEVRRGYVLPGLWDGHGHLLQYGEFLHSVDLFGATSAEEVRGRIARYLEGRPDGGVVGGEGEWIRGVGWDQNVLGEMPTAAMLEEHPLLKGKYMMLDRVDVHCTLVSPAVLALLPSPLPPSPPGGEIITSPGPGVFCDTAMESLILPLWPKPSPQKKLQFLRSATTALHQVGLVGVHDAGVLPSDLDLYRALPPTLRVYAMLECPTRNTFCPAVVPSLPPATPFLTVRAVKLFADGALGSWGSALLEPYTDRPETSGSLLLNASALTYLTKAWSAPGVGFQVAIHAIGDLANRLVVDAILAALEGLCGPGVGVRECQRDKRFRIEHAQIVHPVDLERMKDVGVVASVQPTHATSDGGYVESRLGRERTRREGYRMRSLLGGEGGGGW